ncbi:cdc42 effector protein 3-like [Conger conger]|uniref:cdc42 effector protein 3-like n=1 Tax=Conger conger TaxID=82655 RepID=UPI002A599486|nr:cdc42 effector protein 3-like [Conger conger]XP_061073837.1 cdc42 effector protein 3-like [Conger conger]XP_061073845.1 cdc42 effector protein 3-like [Conger conger]
MPFKNSLYRKASFARWSRKQPKRRELVSVNMISLPLGDFRHLAHIGAQACHDSFGDLSFLKSGHSLFRQSSQSEQNLFLACAPPPKPPRLNLEETDAQTGPAWEGQRYPSQRQKKCSSMPLLDCDEGDELAPEAGSGSTGRYSYSSGRDAESLQTCPEEPPGREDDSAFTLDLDLGPSILDDVLQVMDKLHQ